MSDYILKGTVLSGMRRLDLNKVFSREFRPGLFGLCLCVLSFFLASVGLVWLVSLWQPDIELTISSI